MRGPVTSNYHNKSLALACLVLLLAGLLVPATVSARQVSLTSSDLPYTASTANDTLTISGTKITSNGSGILIEAANVVLNFGTDTLVFGNDGSNSKYGLKFKWGNRNCKVIGGVILHGDPVSTGSPGVIVGPSGTMGVYVDDGDNLIFQGTSFIVGGHNGRCVYSAGASHNVTFDGCKFWNYTWGYTSRCDYQGAVMNLQGTLPSLDTGYHWAVVRCSVFTGPHAGVKVGGKALVHDNYIKLDARNHYYDHPGGNFCETSVDPFAIAGRNLRGGSMIYNNVIRSGSQYEGCGGIFLERALGSIDDTIKVFSNDIYVWNGRNDYEYTNGGWVFGTFWRSAPTYIHFYSNRIRVKVDDDESTTAIGKVGHAGKFEFGSFESDGVMYTGHDCLIENNILEVEIDGTTTTTVGLSMQQTYGGVNENILFRNNRISGGDNIVELGTDNGTGGNLDMRACTLSFTGNESSRHTWSVNRGNRNNIENYVRDIVYQGSAVDTDIYMYTTAGYECELTLMRTLKVFVKGNNNLPVTGANVTVTNNYGQTVLSGVSDSGIVKGAVAYHYESYNGVDSTNFNDFNISVSRNGETVNSTITVGPDYGFDRDTLQLTNSTGSGEWGSEEDAYDPPPPPPDTTVTDTIPPADIDDLEASVGSETGAVQLAWTAPGDDGSVGMADRYYIRYSTDSITEGNFGSAVNFPSHTSPKPAGQTESIQVTGLETGVTYYFASQSVDEASNSSGLSNVPSSEAGSISAPTPNALVIDTVAKTVTITVNAIESSGSYDYEFQVDDDLSFADAQIVFDREPTTTASALYDNLLDNTLYYWRCRAVSTDGGGSSGFTTAA